MLRNASRLCPVSEEVEVAGREEEEEEELDQWATQW